jgi:HlyD family secretion protein
VEKAEAALADAKRQEARAQELFAQGLTSRADVDTATANRQQASASVSVAQAQVLQARADRDTAAVNLAYTKIESPIDGIVVSRSVDVGQTVAASFQTPTLFLIANDLTRMQILANIDEADVGKVKPGLATRFTVDAWPGETFEGKIRDVRQAPTTIQNVVTYAAVIDAPNPRRKLRQGMTASVQITTGSREEVLRVPNAALRFKPAAPIPAEGGGGKAGGRPAAEGEARPPRGERGTWAGRDRASTSTDPAAAKTARRASPAPEPEDGEEGQQERTQERLIDRPGRVYKLVEGKPVAVALRLGLGDAQRTELLQAQGGLQGGLAEGDQLIVGELGGGQQASGSLLGPSRPPGGGGGGGGMRRGF